MKNETTARPGPEPETDKAPFPPLRGDENPETVRQTLAAAVRDPRRWVRWTLPIVAAIVIGSIGGLVFASAINIPRVETLSDFTPSLITSFEDRYGEQFTSYAHERRILLGEDEIPETLQNAILAAEDNRFFQHGGIDALGGIRALIVDIKTRSKEQGASTLTMQLARKLFLSPAKKWRRKIEETLLAVELEKRLSKQQILALYCNIMPLGHGRYGMEAGARYFFDKSVGELSLAESATLVSILPRPADYSPYRRPELVTSKRNTVLMRMRQENYISQEEYEAAIAEPLVTVTRRQEDELGPYFSEEVRKTLEATYGTERLYQGGLRASTTLDPTIQRATEEAIRDGLLRLDHRRGWRGTDRTIDLATLDETRWPSWTGSEIEIDRWYEGVVLDVGSRSAQIRILDQDYTLDRSGVEWTRRSNIADLLSPGDVAWFRFEQDEADAPMRLILEQAPELEAAALVLESATGAIRAMVGGWDYDRNQFNRAAQARRQVGSAFKLFVYGAALEQGFTPADTLFDGPTAFLGGNNQLSYLPRNHNRKFSGVLTLRRALERSVNVPAVKLLDMIGVERVIEFARRCGIESELPPYPSLALGAAELSPIEFAAAYAAVANHGAWVKPYLIEKVVDHEGNLLEQHQPSTRNAMSPEIAYVLTSMLHGVTKRGSGRRLRNINLDLAGKTGTTDRYSDAWFVGFSPRHTLLVWVGHDVKRSIGPGMDGASAALPIWQQIVESGLENGWEVEGERFTPPAGISFTTIDYASGLLPGPGSETLIEEAFVAGTEPAQVYTDEWGAILSLPWYQQQPFYIPKAGERMPGDERAEDEIENEAEQAP